MKMSVAVGTALHLALATSVDLIVCDEVHRLANPKAAVSSGPAFLPEVKVRKMRQNYAYA